MAVDTTNGRNSDCLYKNISTSLALLIIILLRSKLDNSSAALHHGGPILQAAWPAQLVDQ